MKNLSKSFGAYVAREIAEWGMEKAGFPFRAIQSKAKYEPVIRKYEDPLSEFYEKLFEAKPTPPKIVFGWNSSYDIKRDKLHLRYYPDSWNKIGTYVMPEEEVLLNSYSEELAHRYHFLSNEKLIALHKRFEKDEDNKLLSESMIMSVFMEGVAKAAKIKSFSVLGLGELSAHYRTHAHARAMPEANDKLSIAVVSDAFLHMEDTDFRNMARADCFAALAQMSDEYRCLMENPKRIHGYVRGAVVFE